jgi:hypothetical protein
MMGRIGRTYPRPATAAKVTIPKGRVLFLSPLGALRYRLQRAQPLVWLCLIIALVISALTPN